jgi:zinc protease
MNFARLAIAFIVSAAASAQPPVAPPLRPYKLPPVFETQLPNGLTVVLVEDTRLPLTTVRLAFACGNRRDPKDMPGLAAAVADLMTLATRQRGSILITEAIEALGGSFNATSGADHIALNGSINAESIFTLLAIAADVARNAEFSDIDLNLYKPRHRQIHAQQLAQSGYAANVEFRKALFGDHPYAHVGPTSDALEKMNRQALLDYRDRWLVPNNAYLIMVGNLPPRADTMKAITDLFGPWPRRELPEIAEAKPPARARRLILVDRPGAPQVAVLMGKIAAAQRDGDYLAEIAASMIAGANVSDLRNEPVALDEAGIFASMTQARNDNVAEAIGNMMDRLNRLAAAPPAAAELALVKASAEGSLLFRLETQEALADELMVERLQKLPANYIETWIPRLEALTPEEVQAAAKKFLSSADSVLVVAGDAVRIQPSLAGIGKFEVFR